MNPEQTRKVLNFDPLYFAERATGHSYKEDESTMGLGFLMHLRHTAEKSAMLEGVDDTTMRTKLVDYLRIAKEIGFVMVFEQDIVVPEELREDYDDGRKDRHYIMWHPQHSILLVFDSYSNNTTVNGGNFYYTWRPHNMGDYHNYTSSGGFRKGPLREDDKVWVGSHDCREALRFHISELLTHGEFLSQWTEYPRPWLMHYGDQRLPKERKDDFNFLHGPYGYWSQVNCGYASRLPEYVQKAICFNTDSEG
jgi:hypothetical protein